MGTRPWLLVVVNRAPNQNEQEFTHLRSAMIQIFYMVIKSVSPCATASKEDTAV
jgi:hypothetical protein